MNPGPYLITTSYVLMVSPMELLRSRWPLPTTAHLRHFKLREKSHVSTRPALNQGGFNPPKGAFNPALATLQSFPCSVHPPWVAEVHSAKSWAHNMQISTSSPKEQ